MPSNTKQLQEARENAEDGELPYVSKSRLTKHIKCPRAFYFSYVLGIKEPENYHMVKGTRLHHVFEKYYENVLDHYASDFVEHPLPTSPWELQKFLPSEWQLYADFAPYIGNFFQFELTRATQCRTISEWVPVGIEAEEWDYDQDPPWMGFADVILPAVSVPGINEDDGVAILDFKTGKTPDKKYRGEGIFTEGEFYGMLFESRYDVAGVAGYYPKNNDLVVSPLSASRRDKIRDEISDMNGAEDKEDYPTDTGPLCKWDTKDGGCHYLPFCKDGQAWAEVSNHPEEFMEAKRNGATFEELSEIFPDAAYDSFGYWSYKLPTLGY